MFEVFYFENDNCVRWLEQYYRNDKKPFFSFFNFVFFKKSSAIEFQKDVVCLKERIVSYVDTTYGYNKHVLNYINNNNIRNYKIAEQFLFLEKNKFEIIINKDFDLNSVILNVEIFRYGDLIRKINISTDEEDFTELRSILKGDVIMSKNKEDYLVDAISVEMSEYGIDLSDYDYLIKEIGNNKYEMHLENLNSGKSILIRDIFFNKDNKILSIGQNNGLVL